MDLREDEGRPSYEPSARVSLPGVRCDKWRAACRWWRGRRQRRAHMRVRGGGVCQLHAGRVTTQRKRVGRGSPGIVRGTDGCDTGAAVNRRPKGPRLPGLQAPTRPEWERAQAAPHASRELRRERSTLLALSPRLSDRLLDPWKRKGRGMKESSVTIAERSEK